MIKGVINILITDGGVQALVGQNAAEEKYKVYPVVCPQEEKAPYIAVRQTGMELAAKGYTDWNFQFAVVSYATSYDECFALDMAVLNAFINVTGTYENTIVSYINPVSLGVDGYTQDHGGIYYKTSTFSGVFKEVTT